MAFINCPKAGQRFASLFITQKSRKVRNAVKADPPPPPCILDHGDNNNEAVKACDRVANLDLGSTNTDHDNHR